MTVEVFLDHAVVGQHSDEASWTTDEAGNLHVSDGQPQPSVYPHGQWHGIGSGWVCIFLTPSASCQRCNPPRGHGGR